MAMCIVSCQRFARCRKTISSFPSLVSSFLCRLARCRCGFFRRPFPVAWSPEKKIMNIRNQRVVPDRHCEAALTLSFKGSGAAAVFECETQVSVKAYGVELDDGGIDIENPALKGLGAYVPGSSRVNFVNGTNVWQTAVGASFPQTLELALPHLGTAPAQAREAGTPPQGRASRSAAGSDPTRLRWRRT